MGVSETYFGTRVPRKKIQISLGIRTVSSLESPLDALWIAKDAKLFHADIQDADQTARIQRLICVFVGHNQKVRLLEL